MIKSQYILLIIIVIILLPFVTIFYTDVVQKKTGLIDDIKIIDINLPSQKQITHIHKCVDIYGNKSNPNRNFNNVSCMKLNYYGIKKCAPYLLNMYFTSEFCKKIATILNIPKLHFLDPNVDSDCIFVKKYIENDHMSLHYDNNFSVGNRYTIVIPIYTNNYNVSKFLISDKYKRLHVVHIPSGKAAIYNGSEIYHGVSVQSKQGIRTSLIFHMYDNKEFSTFGKIRKYSRDIAFKIFSL
jgi:hypothetical protein